ncbi:DUF3383 family protein [Candidatus Pacearchaeota archaeon]|nr:DUF3383 family protein [Candidatus Pacearchaeota archaeon]
MPKIDKIVRVTSQITGGGVLRRDFGILMFVTTDASVLGTGSNRIAVVANADDASIFALGTEPRTAMDILYQQVPFPKNCVIGRWINADVEGELLGVEPSAFSVLNAISDASFECLGEDFTLIDLTVPADLAGIATLIETALQTSAQAQLVAATCTYNVTEGRFEVKTGTTGVDALLTVFSTTDPLVGTDISTLIGLDSLATLNQGAAEETITEAIEAIIALNDSPFFITLEDTIIDEPTLSEVRAWVQARAYMFFMDNFEAGALTPDESSSVLATFFALQPDKVVSMWSETEDYKAVSFAGRYSSVNFAGANTLITGNLKELPGTLSDDISTTAQAELERKYSNYYAPFFSTGSPPVNGVFNGTTMKPNVWADVQYFLQWAVNAVRVDVFNLLRNSNKVPQTEAGMAAIQGVIEAVMVQGVRNGGIAPGQLSAASILDVQLSTENPDFDGFLTTGFLVFAPGIFTQSQSDRNDRKSPPWKVWMKGSGAIQEVDIALIFEN